MLSPWLGVVPVVGVVTVIRAATSRGGKKRRGGLDARDDRYGCLYCILVENTVGDDDVTSVDAVWREEQILILYVSGYVPRID